MSDLRADLKNAVFVTEYLTTRGVPVLGIPRDLYARALERMDVLESTLSVERIAEALRKVGQTTPASEKELWGYLRDWIGGAFSVPDAVGLHHFAAALQAALLASPVAPEEEK